MASKNLVKFGPVTMSFAHRTIAMLSFTAGLATAYFVRTSCSGLTSTLKDEIQCPSVDMDAFATSMACCDLDL